MDRCKNQCSPSWCLCNPNDGRLKEGDKVKTRGDFGSFKLIVKKIHNEHYACCVNRFGFNERHFNINVLEKEPKK